MKFLTCFRFPKLMRFLCNVEENVNTICKQNSKEEKKEKKKKNLGDSAFMKRDLADIFWKGTVAPCRLHADNSKCRRSCRQTGISVQTFNLKGQFSWLPDNPNPDWRFLCDDNLVVTLQLSCSLGRLSKIRRSSSCELATLLLAMRWRHKRRSVGQGNRIVLLTSALLWGAQLPSFWVKAVRSQLQLELGKVIAC